MISELIVLVCRKKLPVTKQGWNKAKGKIQIYSSKNIIFSKKEKEKRGESVHK